MKNFTFNNVVTATAFSLAVGLSSQASAEQVPEQTFSARVGETQSISIPYANGDLTTDKGRANLFGKIKRAAKEVCGPTGLREAGGLSMAAHNRKCYDAAMDAAVSQVETRQLASLVN
jgi:UrcA family protein